METIGGISANVGMNKVISYYDDIDLENEANLNDGGIIVIENGDLSVIINQTNNAENHINDQIARGSVRGRSSRGRGNPRKEPPRKNQRPIIEILSFMSMNNSNNDTLTNHIQKHNLNSEKHGFVPGILFESLFLLTLTNSPASSASLYQ